MNKLLITGGFGYIGGRLAQYLIKQEYEILLGTRRDANSPDWLPEAGVQRMLWESQADIERACHGVTAIVHLAGMNAQQCASDPVSAIEFNAGSTARLLQVAIKNGVERFIYVSTVHVYGGHLEGDITEHVLCQYTRMLPVTEQPRIL